MSPRKEIHMATKSNSKSRKKNYGKKSKQYHSASNPQTYSEAEAQVQRALKNGHPFAGKGNLLDGEKLRCPESCFVIHQGLYAANGQEDGRSALQIVVYPQFPDYLGISKNGEYVVANKAVFFSAWNTYLWLQKNFNIVRQMYVGNIDPDIPAVTTTISRPPRAESAGERFIIGRKFDYIGTAYSQECLYQQEDSKQFSLEITLVAKELDMQGFLGGEPCIFKVAVPLSAKSADRWVRYTGAPDVETERYIREFRASFTNLDPDVGLTLPDWRRKRTA